ncbi:unnamed protein product [Effrenium voratum]|uniref:Uncharacterized protein n=1 Tax=Effrenium voratum TaxID=2562239 RepID=A0AA36JAD6_9DINO|nr:unnamed protein product [Effrenium voratum]
MCHIAWAGGCTVGHKWSPFRWPVGREHPMLEVERSAKVQKGLEATKIKSCGPSLPVACPACRMRGGKAASAAYCAAWLGAWALQARDARSAMKIAVILLAAAAAVKLRLDRSLVDPDSDDQWCSGNQFPLDVDSLYHAAGLAKGEDLFDKNELKQFQAGLKASPDWAAASTWHLRVTVNSSLSVATNFGFPGFQVTVPAGAQGELQITDRVESSLDPSFRYLDGPDVLNGDVTFTKFCLRPKLCGEEDFCTDGWKPKVSDTVLPGNSRVECCEVILCSEAPEVDSCSGTIWTPKPNFTELQGHTKDRCCHPVWCEPNIICKGSDVKAKNGTGLRGSTPEECCEPAYCRHFACPSETQYTLMVYNADGSARRGSTTEDCCKEEKCSELDCSTSPRGSWKNKTHPSGLGSTYPECCEESYCVDFACQPSSQWQHRKETSIRGGDHATCCQPLKCAKYTCKDPTLAVRRLPDGKLTEDLGSSDDECCELKPCQDYTCSDPTMWTLKPVLMDGSLRKGFDDDTCCEAIYCEHSMDCERVDGSKWRSRGQRGLQGSTKEQCCHANLCDSYTCSSDVDGDGDGTQWYKKVDTNAHQYLGQTDEECCFPKYCSQYVTKLPLSKWKRNNTKGLQGSTDGECYLERKCLEEVDCHALGVNLTDATRLGSTRDECCW